MQGKQLLSALRRDQQLYLLALPGIVFFLIFKYVPMWGILISFQNYSPFLGFWDSEWVGLEHFQRFFSNPDFWLLLRNTMAINLLNLLFFFPLPIVLALLLNEIRNQIFKRSLQSIVYLPHFLSWVIIAGITILILSPRNGVMNEILLILGLEKVDLLSNESTFWLLLTVQSIWKEAGWGTIIFLAALAGIDPQLYEAAKMDGANKIRQMWHVSLPSIRSVIIILLILRLGNIMDVGFEQVFLMGNSAVSDVAEVFDTYVYRLGVQQGAFSFTTAVGLFKSVVGLLLVLGTNYLVKRMGEEGVY